MPPFSREFRARIFTNPGDRPIITTIYNRRQRRRNIPELIEAVSAVDPIDGYVAINGNLAIQCSIDLAQREGSFVGTRSGATLAGALQVAAEATHE